VVFLAAPSQSGEMPCEFAHQILSPGVAGMTLCRECVRPLDNFYPNTCRVLVLRYKWYRTYGTVGTVGTAVGTVVPTVPWCRGSLLFSDISFGMCLNLMSWVQQVHNAAVVARSLV